jgi:uracil-DNA glycosylase
MRNVGAEALDRLDETYHNCQLCPALCASRTQVVHSSGKADATIVVVGESPGHEEDSEGIPFIGPGSVLLLELLKGAWPNSDKLGQIEESRDLIGESEYYAELREFFGDYILWTNVVQCLTPEGRAPTPAEIKACRDRLLKTVYAADPLLIIALGKTAGSAMLGKTVKLQKTSGAIYDVSIPSPTTGEDIRYPLLILPTPEYLLKRGDHTLIDRKQGEAYGVLEALRWALDLVEKTWTKLYQTPFEEDADNE